MLGATLADANRLGLRIARIPPLAEVDTAEDLAAWRALGTRSGGEIISADSFYRTLRDRTAKARCNTRRS